jgi:hypothetical protein
MIAFDRTCWRGTNMSNSMLLVFAATMGVAAYMFFVGWFVG